MRPPIPDWKWRYLAVHVVRREGVPVVERVLPEGAKPEGLEAGIALHDALSRLGELEWELTGIDPSLRDDDGATIYVFKRLA
jgi:hypothetical protein